MEQVIAEQATLGHCHAGTWQKHQEIIHELASTLHSRFFIHCDSTKPFHVFAMAVGQSTVKACLLHAIRPTAASTAPNAPSVNSDYVLSLAIETLESSQACIRDPSMARWRWTLWVQWHALAATFASLTFVTSGPLSDRAWVAAEQSLDQFASITANAQQAQLKKPLEKLAAKARQARTMQQLSRNALSDAQDRSIQQPDAAGYEDTSMSIDEVSLVAPYGISTIQDLPLPQDLETGGDAEWWPIWQEFVEGFPDPLNTFGS